jgi:hypothetical protein
MGTTSCYKFFSSKTVVDSPAKFSSAPKQLWIHWPQTRNWSEKGKQKSLQKFNASSSDHTGNYSLSLSLSLSLSFKLWTCQSDKYHDLSKTSHIKKDDFNPVLLQDTSAAAAAAAGWQRSTTRGSCNWLVTLNGAKSRLLKSLIRAAKRIYVQQVMLQQEHSWAWQENKNPKKKKRGGSRRLNNPSLKLMVDLQSFYGFILVVS